jgi:hypothetical protein
MNASVARRAESIILSKLMTFSLMVYAYGCSSFRWDGLSFATIRSMTPEREPKERMIYYANLRLLM